DKQKYMDIAERCAEKAGEINNVDETAKFRRRYVFDTSDKFDTVDGKLTSSDMHHKCRNMRDAISRLATSGCYRTYLSVYLWQGAEDFEYASAPYANQTPLTLNGDNALQWKPVDCKYVPKSNGPLPAPLQRGTKDIKS